MKKKGNECIALTLIVMILLSLIPAFPAAYGAEGDFVFTFYGNEDKLTGSHPLVDEGYSSENANNKIYTSSSRAAGVTSTAAKYYTVQGNNGKTLTADIPLAQAGTYKVSFLNVLGGANEDPNAAFEITDKNGTETVRKNLQEPTGWIELGTFEFTDKAVIQLIPAIGKNIRADSLKFEKVTGGDTPEPSPSPTSSPAERTEAVVDVSDSENYSETGTWTVHTSLKAHDGENAPFSKYNTEKATGIAATFSLPADMGAGEYKLYYYQCNTNTNQSITVDGKNTNFDPKSPVGWVQLGDIFNLTEDSSVSVNQVGSGYARATAIKFVKLVEEPDDPSKYPVASDVTLTGGKATGEKLSASYSFSDPQGHDEKESSYRFYSADSADADDWKVVASGTTTAAQGAEYVLKTTDAQKYFKFEITPKSDSQANNVGLPVASAVFGPTDSAEYNGPRVIALALTGETVASKAITASYGFRDDSGAVEGDSTFEWLRSLDEDGADWEVVRSGITDASKIANESYILGYADIGKRLKIRITPKNADGVTGQAVESDVLGPVTMVNDTLIIDNLEAGYSDSDDGSGKWGDNTYTETNYAKTHRWTNVKGQWAKFEPSVIKPGEYNIFYYIPYSAGDKALQVAITHQGGVAASTLDLSNRQAGTWLELGKYTIMPNSGHNVKVIASGEGYLRADAVKFEMVQAADAKPFADDVTVKGGLAPGRVLSGDYSYVDYFAVAEGQSEYLWQSGSSVDFQSPEDVGTEKEYTLREADVGKYIRFGVKVSNADGVSAAGYVFSEPTAAIPDKEYAPEVSNVTISGEKIAGASLTGTYQYSDKNLDPEAESKYTFFEADASGNKIKEVKSGACRQDGEIVYQTGENDAGKYYILEITPVSTQESDEGTAAVSAVFGPIVQSTIKPAARDVKISTMIATGSPAEVKYTYYHALKQPEGETTFQWYIADSAVSEFTAIPGATGSSYTPTADQQFKYILCEVTPVSISAPKVGEPVRSAPVYIKWQTEFADEFDYEAADGWDEHFRTIWTPQNGPQNHILGGRYPENMKVTDGKLYMLNKKEHRNGQDWTSGSITGNQEFFYGYYEASYKYAPAPGLNQSFWIMSYGGYTQGNGAHEIDINEGHYPSGVNLNTHYMLDGKSTATGKKFKFNDIDFSKDFHTFGLDWQEDYLVYYLDGEEIWRLKNTMSHKPAPIWFSVAITDWAGEVSDAIDGTATEVEYIRHYTEADNKPAEVDKEALNLSAYEAKAIIDGYNNKTQFYPKAEIEKLQAALDETVLVINNPAATQQQVNEAKAKIDAAVEHIKTTALGDKTALIEKIALAQNELNTTQPGNAFGQFTAASRQTLQNAIQTAQQTADSDSANQEAVNEAVTTLEAAIRTYRASVVTVSTVGANDGDIIIPADLTKDVILTFPEKIGKSVVIPSGAKLRTNITLNLKSGEKEISLQFNKGLEIGGETGGSITLKIPADRTVSATNAIFGLDLSTLNIAENDIKGAVRISFSRENDAKAGIVENSEVHDIKAVLSDDTLAGANKLITAGGEAKLDRGLVIWTRNFDAAYAVYQEKKDDGGDDNINDNPNNNNNNSGSGGSYWPGVVLPGGSDGEKSKFIDISGHWAEKDITELSEKKIIKGRTEELFAPEDQITRAEFAALICRAIGLSEQGYTGGFSDVSGEEWYAGEIAAIVQSGIMSGADGLFRPNDVITREEMAKVMVEAYQIYTENSINAIAVLFDDSSDISGWAAEYVNQAVSAGLMNGTGEKQFSPKSNATRAQAAAVIARLLRK